jgi:Mrp family chromosome partitioning ATPase
MFSDPYLIGKLVDGVIIVYRTGKTRTELLKRVVNDLRTAGINLLGIVIQNRESREKYGYGYYRYYSQSVKEQEKANQFSRRLKKIHMGKQ